MLSKINKILKLFFLTMFFMMLSEVSFSQSHKSSSKKAVKNFEKAHGEYLYDNCKALDYVEKALRYDENYLDALLLKAELYLDMCYDSLALISYERVFEIDSMAYPKTAISLSKLYMKYFCYNKSVSLLDWFLSLPNQKESVRMIAEHELSLAKFRKELVENPVDYNPKNIGGVVNSSDDEYINQYYSAEEKIVFTNFHRFENLVSENVYVSYMFDSVWTLPKPLIEYVGAKDIGAANISSNGNEIYFSGCGWDDGFGSCDIYYVELKNGKWSEPINLKTINTSEWESQPCVSSDGNELYFVRGNKKTGSSNIYVSKRDDNGCWQKANRLSSDINTKGNEMAPFIHNDGKTLYFSSDTHLGMGGYDLFVSRRKANGEWTKPVNMGYPLNDLDNQMNLVVADDGLRAFVSVKRIDGYGGYDIYEFELDDDFRPQSLEIENTSVDKYYADILEKQESVVLKNIYFEFDSFELKSDSEEGIDAIYKFLDLNPDRIIMLEGHTDDVGSEEYNLKLSEKRAESVKTALTNKGISPERIKTKGCGNSQPLSTNNFDDELKTLSRRVSMSLVD